jgi:predicted nucleotide-binding protein (sugar kinase/HSP70/actin superfamily)
MNVQTLKCIANTNITANWNRQLVACVPVSCKTPPPGLPNLAKKEFIFNPNVTTSRQYQTTVVYSCPANTTLPEMIASAFSFDYSLSAGFIYNVTAVCDLDG